jgi:hypothetical protein
VPVAAFDPRKSSGRRDIEQRPPAGTANYLDSIQDRLMFRLQYQFRRLQVAGDHAYRERERIDAVDARQPPRRGALLRAAAQPARQQLLRARAGAQLSTTNRRGDYSALTVDPADDCTFWYTTEYYTAASQATSAAGWLTRIGSFSLTASKPAQRCRAGRQHAGRDRRRAGRQRPITRTVNVSGMIVGRGRGRSAVGEGGGPSSAETV